VSYGRIVANPTGNRHKIEICDRTPRGALITWLLVPQVPDRAMLLGHLSPQHPAEVGTLLDQIRTREDIATVAARAFAGGRGETSEFITHDV
jgi:hypothetical protein